VFFVGASKASKILFPRSKDFIQAMRLRRKTKISNTINAYLRNSRNPRFKRCENPTKPNDRITPALIMAGAGLCMYICMYACVCTSAPAAHGTPARPRKPATQDATDPLCGICYSSEIPAQKKRSRTPTLFHHCNSLT
jgi:hypothetical protein